jgi:pseudaminic acid biosynthesis-associated methylase
LTNHTKQLNTWAGKFGRGYTDRNAISLGDMDKMYKKNYGITRSRLDNLFLDVMPRSSKILEIGSNIGNQLAYLQKMGFKDLYGIEPQQYAVEFSKKRTAGINIIHADAFDVPFKDKYFDVVFTSGVLIHINPKDIVRALKEIYRCSKKYIWGFEYYSDKYTEVVYRGNKNLLWKADFPRLYLDLFPDLKLVKIKFFKYPDDDNVDAMFLLRKKRVRGCRLMES